MIRRTAGLRRARPDQQGEILLEAAAAWRRAGDDTRALELWRILVAVGGEDGQFARLEIADLLLEAGDRPAAYGELAAVRAEGPSTVGICELAAELLEEHGDLDESLAWFNLAAGRLDEDDLARLRTGRWYTQAGHVLAARCPVRRALGLPPDALDLLAARSGRPGPDYFPSISEVIEGLDGSAMPPAEARVLAWTGVEATRAAERWPWFTGPDYHQRTESRLRALAAHGAARITLVLGSVEGLAQFAVRSGGAPEDSATRRASLDEIHRAGVAIGWPPPRNGPCWCSRTKYKKCCGTSTGAAMDIP